MTRTSSKSACCAPTALHSEQRGTILSANGMKWALFAGVAVGALAASPAMAQSDPPSSPPPTQEADNTAAGARPADAEIIITGTQIRGIAPAGSQVIGVNSAQIQATGGASTNQVLSGLPQLGNLFNGLPVGVSPVSGANASNPITRPNLRNLPGANTSGGAQTLVLFDGHRVVGAGTQQVAVDPDILAPGVIEHIEALTDGGSAVYGSDALGGVLNFITRRSFDGVAVSARYGFGDDYHSVDGSLMAGTTWEGGGAYMAYGYSHHDDVFGIDRDFVRRVDWTGGVPGTPVGRNCANPNITVGGVSYVVSGATVARGGPNTCDPSDDFAIYPRMTLHNVFGRVRQDLNDWIHVDLTAFYANRKLLGNGGTLGTGALGSGATATVTVTAANPNYRSTGDANAGLSQSVQFNYGPVFGFRAALQRTNLETISVNPSVAFDLGGGFQLRTAFGYGWSQVDFQNTEINAAAQTAGLGNGSLNPYNVSASNPNTLAGLRAFSRGIGRNELYDYHAIVDGPLFTLPGGEVRVAFGAEHMQDNFQRRVTNTSYVLQRPLNYTQKVDSLFGEVQVPIVGRDSGMTMLRELILSASARYDRYNDFGDTFNPKIGVTWRPVDWIAIRGNWGKSFNAPSPTDQLGQFTSTAALVPGAFLQAPTVVPGVCGGALPACSIAGQAGVFLGNGSVPGIQPQRATSWSIGAELRPPFLEGLSLSISYYNIDLNGTIGRPVTGQNLAPFYANFPNLSIYRPSGQQLAAFLTSIQPGNIAFTLLNPTSTAQAQVFSAGSTQLVGVALDTLVRNLGVTKLDGIDFAVNYRHATGFGSVDASFAGNYRLNQKTQVSPASPINEELNFDNIRLNFAATLGADVGGLRAQLTWNHSSGYDRGDGATPGAFGQTHVPAFNAFNLFVRYNVPETTFLGSDLQLTLNVQNIFDVAPAVFYGTGTPGYNNGLGGFTIGRVIQFGISKRF